MDWELTGIYESNLINIEDKETPLINKIAKKLNEGGFACVSQGGMNGERHFHFLHKKTGAYFHIGDNESQDEEEIWTCLQTDDEEIKMSIIRDTVHKFFEEHRDNKITLQELILRLCRYSDHNIHSEGNMEIFEESLKKEFDNKGNIAQ